MKHSLKTLLLVIIISFLFILVLINCDQKSGEKQEISHSSISGENTKFLSLLQGEQLPKNKKNLPNFTLLNDNSYEDAGTAKVIWEILVHSSTIKDSLTDLLNDLFIQAQSKKFKQHSTATVIDIKVYQSKEHAESGMGQWIGWISKSGGQNQPNLIFNDRQISQLGKKPEEKFGLTEEKRKEIWQEAIRAEDKATKEAERKYPEPSPGNDAAFMEAFDKRSKLTEQLINKYHNELVKKYGITRKQLSEIAEEGFNKSWPFPN